LFLADLDIKNKLKAAKGEKVRLQNMTSYHGKNQVSHNLTMIPKQYQWIENRLLHIPISDHRKITIELVLAPYLVVIKQLSFNEAYTIIREWIVQCNSLEMLKPSIDYFDTKIKTALNNSIQCSIPPIRRENMQRKYPDWYDDFKIWCILD
jgi:Primase X